MAATSAAVPEAPQPIGAFGRLIGALVSPRATFEDIARKPGWVAPVVLLILVNIALTGAFSHRVGWRAFLEKQDEQNSTVRRQMEQMKPEQREQMIERQAKFAPIFGYVGGIIGVPVVLLIIAAIFMGIFNATASANLDFKTSLGIAAHAYLPLALVGLLGILIIFLRPPDAIDLQNLIASNPAVFLGNSAPLWLKTLMTSLDLFTFWVIGLLAFGYSVARPRKIKLGTALKWVTGVWIVFVAIRVGLSALAA